MDVNGLRSQHQELSALADHLLQAVEDDSTPQAIGAVRWRFTRLLMTHLALEERIFHPVLQRIADERIRSAAMRMHGEIGALAQTFSAYMHRWSDDQIVREWPAFCEETRATLSTIRCRSAQEEALLYPLAEQATGSESMLDRTG